MIGTGTLIRVVPPMDLAYLSTDSGEVFNFPLSMLSLSKPLKSLGLRLSFRVERNIVVEIEVASKTMTAHSGG